MQKIEKNKAPNDASSGGAISIFQNFTETEFAEKISVFMVVKSQDQIERRERMLKSRQEGGKYGRLSDRPVAEGLLINATLAGGKCTENWSKIFPEPRHICSLPNGHFLMTAMDEIVEIDHNGNILKKIGHPKFSYLHTIDYNPETKNCLIASSGYDSIMELNWETGEMVFDWSAWEHGFNPDPEGNWLTFNPAEYRKFIEEGKKAHLIDPQKMGNKGLLTSFRSAHPNSVAYNPNNGRKSILATMGYGENIYEIDLNSGESKIAAAGLASMPHGVKPYKNGWMITNTTRGEYLVYDRNFNLLEKHHIRDMPYKVAGVGDAEWLQQVIYKAPFHIFIDANRGLFLVDLAKKKYQHFPVNENYCVQDIIILEGAAS